MDETLVLLYDVGGPKTWHQRYVLGVVECSENDQLPPYTAAVSTPDVDVYLEDLNVSANDDSLCVRVCDALGNAPGYS